MLSVEISTESIEHMESFSGQRMTYGKMQKSKSAKATLTLFEATPENLAIALYAKRVKLVAGNVTGEALPAVDADATVVLNHNFVRNLAITEARRNPWSRA